MPKNMYKASQPSFIDCTLSEAIDAFGFGSYQLVLVLCLGITLFSCAIETIALIVIRPLSECGWEISSLQDGNILPFLATISMIVLAAPLLGYAADRFGRKLVINISVSIQMILATLIVLVPENDLFLVLRLFYCCMLASLPVSYVLLAEYTPNTSRGQSAMLLQMFLVGGEILTILLSWSVVHESQDWKIIIMIGTFPLILFISTSYWLPESVLYLSKMAKEEELGYHLNNVATFNGKLDVLDQMEINNILITDKNAGDPCFEIFQLILGERNLRSSLITWTLWFLNGIAYFGTIFITSMMYTWIVSCYNHKTDDIKMVRVQTIETETCSLIDSKEYEHFVWNSLAEFPAVFISALIIDILGRRNMYIMCIGIFAVSLSPLIIRHCEMDSVLPFVLLFMSRGAGIAWFGNNIVFSLESYSTKTRCTGLGIGLSFMLLGGIAAYFIQQYLKPYSVAIIIFIYFSTSVMGFLLVMHLPTEEMKSDLGYVGEVMVEKNDLPAGH